MRAVLHTAVFVAALLGAHDANATPLRLRGGMETTLRHVALHPIRALGGAITLAGLQKRQGVTIFKLRERPQDHPRQVRYLALAGMGMFAQAEQMLARANMTGKASVANINGQRLVVRTNELLSDVNTRLYLQMSEPRGR